MKICFAAPHALGLFEPDSTSTFGGAEVRAWLFGNALARLPGIEVNFSVIDDSPVECSHYGEITVWKDRPRALAIPGPKHRYALSRYLGKSEGFPYFKLVQADWRIPFAVARHLVAVIAMKIEAWFSPSPVFAGAYQVLPSKFRLFEKINADVYCVFGVSTYAAELIAYCKRRNKKTVLFLSSDEDISSAYSPSSFRSNCYGSRYDLCHFSLMNSDQIIAQTHKQANLLETRFGRHSKVILNPVDLTTSGGICGFSDRRYCLWVGKSDIVKQPEVLLRLAQANPMLEFRMVLNRSDPLIFARMMRLKPPNLLISEKMPFAKMDRLFRRARVLINTSAFEGFPNTFLQAGKYGTPILSLNVDPDGVIEQNEGGFVAKGRESELAAQLALLHNDAVVWQSCSTMIRQYVEKNHDLEAMTAQLKELLLEIM